MASVIAAAPCPVTDFRSPIAGHVSLVTVPAVIVLQALDVILAEIITVLDLDDRHRRLAGIGHAMDCVERNVDRLVLLDGLHVELVHIHADGYLGYPLDHGPMLGAVLVALEGEAGARLDDDALHLVQVADVERLIVAPEAIVAGMAAEHFGIDAAEGADQLL